MNTPNVLLTPRRPALVAGFDNTLDVLVRIQAPNTPEGESKERSRLNLALAIDRSGSMAGRPLDEAKRCASFVVDKLKNTDRVSLIAYDSSIETLVPSINVEDKAILHRAIEAIDDGGCTNLHGGWLKGAEQISPHIDPSTISRIILLSDGQANEGLTDEAEIFKQCRELADAGVTTSTYGLGSNFNETLMIGMAKNGQGNSYYGRTADDLMDPFQEELSLLEALFAKQVRASISASAGILFEVLNKYSTDGQGKIQLPDLAYEGEAWMLVRCFIPRTKSGEGDGTELIDIFSVEFTYQDLNGEAFNLPPIKLALPSLPAKAWESVTEDSLTVRRANELEAADIQEKAQQAAKSGDWTEVKRLLKNAKSRAKDDKWLTEVCTNLEKLAESEDEASIVKETSYQMKFMRTRLASLDETNDDGLEIARPMYLRKKREQGKKA